MTATIRGARAGIATPSAGTDRDFRLSRDEYRDIYRRGFLQGYEAGYRDWQRGRRGGYGRDDRYNRQPQGGWSRNW